MPDYLFEVSWEVCNKVGGIHTVIATKALTISKQLGDHYILIGPDVHREDVNLEFEEDPALLKEWKQVLFANHNIRVKTGRWKVKGKPLTILVDFSQFFSSKDDVLKFLWESYRVDSISGQWDYIEPVLFGAAAGKVIESYVNYFCSATDRVVAHFHEWMTASGGLYLQKHSPYVATVFTTHATVMGRCIAGNGLPLYGDMTPVERRRTGAAVQRGCQTFAGKDVGRQFRLFRDGQRPDGARVPLSARQRGRRRYAERLRGRHCLGRGRVARETRFGAQGDDRSRRSLSRRQIRPRTADRRNQRALRVQEQGTGRVRRFAVEALRRRFVATSGAGLRNRAGRKQRAAQRLAGAPERSEQPDRSERAAQYDALSFGSGVGPDHRPDQKFPPDGPGVSGTVGVRAFVPERRRRDFQQTLLRIAVRHGRDGIPVLLRAVGVYSAGKHRFLGADDHYVADRVRPVGRRQTERTQGRRRDRAQRYERFGSSCGHLGRAEKLLRDGSAAIRFVPGVGP